LELLSIMLVGRQAGLSFLGCAFVSGRREKQDQNADRYAQPREQATPNGLPLVARAWPENRKHTQGEKRGSRPEQRVIRVAQKIA
jgi:hypothetical protein